MFGQVWTSLDKSDKFRQVWTSLDKSDCILFVDFHLISDFFWNERFWKFSEEEFEGGGKQGDVIGVVQGLVVVMVDFEPKKLKL